MDARAALLVALLEDFAGMEANQEGEYDYTIDMATDVFVPLPDGPVFSDCDSVSGTEANPAKATALVSTLPLLSLPDPYDLNLELGS